MEMWKCLGQLGSLQRRLNKDDEFRTKYQDTIKTDLKKRLIEKTTQNGILRIENSSLWYLAFIESFIHTNQEKPEKFVIQLRSIKGYF